MAWLTGYTYRKKLTIDNTKVDATLTDFPALVKLDNVNFDFTLPKSDGSDIRFTSSDGTTLLKYERERHDDVAELAEYHTKIPSINSSIDTDFYIYFGNASASDGEDAINVWDSNFLLVTHLYDVTTSTVKNSVDGVSLSKSGVDNPLETNGEVYKAQDFSGDHINIGDIDIDGNGTIESLVNPTNFSSSFGNAILFRTNSAGNGYASDLSLALDNTSGAVEITIGNNTNAQTYTSTLNVSTSVWQYVACKADGTDISAILGTTKQTTSQSYTPTGNAYDYRIGRGGEFNGLYFNGKIGEVRLSDIDRSDAWLKTTKETLFDTLLTYGTTEQEELIVQEFLDLTETLTAKVSLYKQNVTENLQLTEVISKSVSKSIQEFLDLTENVSSNISISKLIQENLDLTENVSTSLIKHVTESLSLTESITATPSQFKKSITENLQLTEIVSASIPQTANNASKIISYNPLIFVTDTDPAKIGKIDITDPENPIHTVFTLTGAKNAKDVARNSVTGFLYVACADGIVVKIDETDLSVQTIIDLGDTDDLQTIEVLDAFNITYTSTDSSTGELYMLDNRTTVLGDFRLDVLSTQKVYGDFQFDSIQVKSMNSDFTVLSTITTGFATMNFNCLGFVTVEGGPDVPIDLGSPVTPLDQLVPIKRTDFVVFVDSVQLEQFDVDLSTINIIHNIGEESTVTFRLNRKHDKMDYDLEGNNRQITNQNAIKITIKGITEFDGFISNLNCQYNETEEFITVTALATEKASSFNNTLLSLPSTNTRLGLYDILIQNPQIYNPVLDPNDDNPPRYLGIKVNLGEKRLQSNYRFFEFDSNITVSNGELFDPETGEKIINLSTVGRIAQKIQNGTFIPQQNYTYFWSPIAQKFGNINLGNISLQEFKYIGTSLSPVSEDLWFLQNAKHRIQRQRDDIITDLGYYMVGTAPFKEINVRNGIFIPKFRWSDEGGALYSILDAGYNFEDYAKEIADLEYQKLFNINEQILPETSCDINLTIDGYYYHSLTLLTRINIDNTTQTDIYKNSNGFPVSIKSININSGNMKTSLTCDNLKSNSELAIIDGNYPDEDDDQYNDEEQRIFIAQKKDMKTGLKVE